MTIDPDVLHLVNNSIKTMQQQLKVEFESEIDAIREEHRKSVLKLKEEHQTEIYHLREEINELNVQNIAKDTKIEHFDEKLKLTKRAVIDTMTAQIEARQSTMAKDITALKLGNNFMTQETTELRGKLETTKAHIKQSESRVDELKQRANNAEDHSRRSNLIFFAIPEENNNFESSKDCEGKVQNLVQTILNTENHINIDRAHRFGGKDKIKNDKPRPMIARLTYFRHKELILQALRQQTGEKYAVSEDYCKETQDVRKELLRYFKQAKLDNNDIKGGFVKYKTLVLIFAGNDKNIYSHYSLQDIKDDPNWYTKPKAATNIN